MRARALVLLIAAACSACLVGPNYKRPNVAPPERYYGQAETGLAEAHSLADVPWWEVFQDPILKDLIDVALRNGFNARLAAARVEEARALYGVSRGELWPGAGYQGGFERTRLDQVVSSEQKLQTKWTAKLGVAWELDLWGRLRRQTEAARAQYLASEEGRHGVLLSLVSDVASAYFELRELDAELAIARRTTAAFQDTYDLFERQVQGGTASALESARAEAALGQVAANIPEIERRIVAVENQINFLLGRAPQPIARDEAPTPLPPDIPPGLPSALLERRPDVRQAEQLLVAANAGVGVAKAAYFPSLNLTGYFGNVSPALSELFSHGKTYDVTAGLLGPLFRTGRIKHSYEAAQARREQAAVQYETAVVNSLSEVSRALVDRTKLVEAAAHRARAVHADQEAVRLATLRYSSGLSAYFEVLDAQQHLFPSEIALSQTHRDQLLAVVDLYRALGGGWQAQTLASPPQPSH